MKPDWIDRVFLERRPLPEPAVPPPRTDDTPPSGGIAPPRSVVTPPAPDISPAPAPHPGAAAADSSPVRSNPVVPDPVVPAPVLPAPVLPEIAAWLLEAAPAAWEDLADVVSSAATRGRRVVAVTGGAAGEGRSTVVAGLAATLRARGLRVAATEAAPLALDARAAATARAADVVLVDAGPWFLGPMPRRGVLVEAALGCDGVILVGRDPTPPSPAWSRRLAGMGLEVLAEVHTFARSGAA